VNIIIRPIFGRAHVIAADGDDKHLLPSCDKRTAATEQGTKLKTLDDWRRRRHQERSELAI